ncbi:hypothetical protein T484DRAFT_1846007, partial [Baffinella frigidus]
TGVVPYEGETGVVPYEGDGRALWWFESFYRTGSIIFGGGQVVLPLLIEEVVKYETVVLPLLIEEVVKYETVCVDRLVGEPACVRTPDYEPQ